jgi:cell wall-associated NlpC family hydrolase
MSRRWVAGAAASVALLAGALGAATAQAGPTCGVFGVDDGSQVWMPWQCAANATIEDAEAEAVDKVGYRYVWGGESPAEGGFDCSGLVHWAFNHAGVPIPRLTAQGYYNSYGRVSYANRRPGDLIFYADGSGAVTHVEIYLGVNGDNNVEEVVAARTSGVGIYRNANLSGLTRKAMVGRIVN